VRVQTVQSYMSCYPPVRLHAEWSLNAASNECPAGPPMERPAHAAGLLHRRGLGLGLMRALPAPYGIQQGCAWPLNDVLPR
jgi:hypothetical protein